MDFKDVYDKALNMTLEQGLSEDNELIKDVSPTKKLQMEMDYKLNGMLFGMNLFENIGKVLKENKDNQEEKGN